MKIYKSAVCEKKIANCAFFIFYLHKIFCRNCRNKYIWEVKILLRFMQKLAIIGAGVSGLTVARLLREKYEVTVYEKESTPGGLVRCNRLEDSLFHTCGGHIFNTKNESVMEFFQSIFDLNTEFIKADRNSSVIFENGEVAEPEYHGLFKKKSLVFNPVPYPVENHVYMFKQDIQQRVINDLFSIKRKQQSRREIKFFSTFLKNRFGDTLYDLYFKPYNEKIWQKDLSKIPLSWLEGKLPMPSPDDILLANFNHTAERQFVHSTFWYEINGGSQYLADRLAEGTNIIYDTEINEIEKTVDGWEINGNKFDKVVFCGNIKDLPKILKGINTLDDYEELIQRLPFNGTTSVFCEIDRNPYSWIYLPGTQHKAHRIICTGNFSPSNTAKNLKLTGTVEFTNYISKEDIDKELENMPMHPRYIGHVYNKYTYPVQDVNTREMIQELKTSLQKFGFYFTGRFADWEYYNMDVAMGAAMKTCKNL